MKGVIPIAALLCGFVLGWLIKGTSDPFDGQHKQVSAVVNPALETSKDPALEHELDFPKSTILTPNQPKDEVMKVTRGVLRDPNLRRRMRNFLALLDGLTPENADVIREVLASASEHEGLAQYQWFLFHRWGEIAGQDVVDATLFAIPELSSDQMRAVISGWADKDLDAALKFVEDLPVGSKGRRAGNTALLQILAKADLDRAAEFLMRQPDALQSDGSLKTLFEEAEAKERTDLFAKWFERAPDAPIKGVLAAKTVEFLLAKSPEEAVEFVTNAGDASWRNWDMYWPVAADYAKRDPKAALDWVLSLPKFPNESAPPGLAAVLEHWHAQQPAAAKDWLLQNIDQPWWPRAARGIMVSLRTSGNEAGAQQFLSEFTPEAQQIIQEDGKKPKPKMPQAIPTK
jgi:hypothetical protein